MSKIYRLRQGLLGQEVNAVESPIRQLRWLKQGTQFFIHHEKHAWGDGCSGQYYCTILVEDSCKCYNVTWPALQMLMEELEPADQHSNDLAGDGKEHHQSSRRRRLFGLRSAFGIGSNFHHPRF